MRVVVMMLLLTLASTGSTLAATAPAPSPPQTGSGGGIAIELLWVASGILSMDKNPSLRVTPAQAAKVRARLQSLIDRKLIRLSEPREAGARAGAQGAAGGGGPADRPGRDLTPAELARLRSQREERQKEIEAAVDEIDKILTAKQVEFIDNLDFDPDLYTLQRPSTARGEGAGPPSGQQLAEMRKRFQATRERTARLFQQTLDYLEKRAKAKK